MSRPTMSFEATVTKPADIRPPQGQKKGWGLVTIAFIAQPDGRTESVDVKLFGQQLDLARSVYPGCRVSVTLGLQGNHWQGKDYANLIMESWQLLDPPAQQQAPPEAQYAPQPQHGGAVYPHQQPIPAQQPHHTDGRGYHDEHLAHEHENPQPHQNQPAQHRPQAQPYRPEVPLDDTPF
jgi:hypothetical protein